MVELCRCPKCGHWNPPAREKCFRCKDKIDPEAAAHSPRAHDLMMQARAAAGDESSDYTDQVLISSSRAMSSS